MGNSLITVNTGMQIVRMCREHVPQVCAIEQQAFPVPWSERMFLTDLRLAHARHLVALVNGPRGNAVIGYVSAWLVLDECAINKIACRKQYRRSGVATQLLDHMAQLVQKEGAQSIVLEVRERNTAARSFYSRCGFSQVGLRRGYYGDSGEDAVVLGLLIQTEACARR